MRTNNSIKNVITTIIPFFIIGILGFVKVKVFVYGLSDDINSLNQLFFQILGYLCLLDGGFGLLLSQKLYKQFAVKNYDEINNIYSTSKIFFKIIGSIIIIIALFSSFVIPYFTKANIPSTYIQFVFLIFVFKNVIDYFVSAPRYVIQADQKMYKINILINIIKILETIFEILFVLLGFNYILVLLPGFFIRIMMNYYINKKIYNEYPWLKFNNKYNKNHLKGIGNIISQKVSGIIYNNTDIILISTFINPLTVICYSSYTYITKFIIDVIYLITNAITPSYAEILNDTKSNNEFTVFKELNILYSFIGSFLIIFLFFIFNFIITLWVGSKYILKDFTIVLLLITFFQAIMERVPFMVINAKAYFRDIRYIVIFQAILNFIISFVLVKKMGIDGVLIGTVLSDFLTCFWYLPKVIYKKVFFKKVYTYFIKYIFILLFSIIVIFGISLINIYKIDNLVKEIFFISLISIIYFVIHFILYYLVFKEFRLFINRILYFFKKNMNHLIND